MSEISGVREWRGFVARLSWETALRTGTYPEVWATKSMCMGPGDPVEVRVIARLPGEPDGLPVGMMSNEGEVMTHPHRGAGQHDWRQGVESVSGVDLSRCVSRLRPADPETYAVVYDGEENQGLDKDTAESLASMLKGRVVRSSELEKPDA